MAEECTLALDLGTTAFKAAAVVRDAVVGKPAVVPCTLRYGSGGMVRCDPERYLTWAGRALRAAARQAQEAGYKVSAIGISSQAQTFVPIDLSGKPADPAIVWTDTTGALEVRAVADAIPNFAAVVGFLEPSPLQFLPKVLHYRRQGGTASRFLLLNEWIVYSFTGEAYGDAVNQGMGGFYDIARLCWNEAALRLAGIPPEALAQVHPAGARAAPLKPQWARKLGVPEGIPVYSCGNDQSCAAVGAGVRNPGEVFANFGTAMVVYALKGLPAEPRTGVEIAGVSPLPNRWFLLGVEAEFGNIVEWLAGLLYPRRGVGYMLEHALERRTDPVPRPRFSIPGGGTVHIEGLRVGTGRETIVRALMMHYADRFEGLLYSVLANAPLPRSMPAAGGISRSAAWLRLLQQHCGIALEATPMEHPGLIGIARIIRAAGHR